MLGNLQQQLRVEQETVSVPWSRRWMFLSNGFDDSILYIPGGCVIGADK